MNNRLIVVVLLATLSCHDPKGGIPDEVHHPAAQPDKDSITYVLFPGRNGGYGFDILENGKVYIHQPFIPSWEGFREFPSAGAATAVASFITSRLGRRDFRFLLDKRDVDSLLAGFPASMFSLGPDPSLSAQHSALPIRTLPALPDAPLKKKWITRGKVPFGKRSIPRSFGIGRRIYIGGGEYDDQYSKDLWCYDTDTRSWTCLATFPRTDTRAGGVSFTVGNKGYWGLGSHAGVGAARLNNDFFEYDPALNRWTRKKNFPGTPRIDAAAFVIGDKGFVGTGFSEKGHTTDMYRYDPKDDHWDRIADFPSTPVSADLGATSGSAGFIVAGDGASGNQRTCYQYDPGTDKWTRKKDMPGPPRYFLTGCSVDTNIFIAGGGGAKDSIIRLRDFYLYNAATGEWSRIKDYPISAAGISSAAAANAAGKVFFGAGFNGNYRDEWNSYDYYFSVNTDTGDYHETTPSPLTPEGKWDLFQECNERDCFAALQLQAGHSLGDISYDRRLVTGLRSLSLPAGGRRLWLFPRNYAIRTDKQTHRPVSIRLFFPRQELEDALAGCTAKTGRICRKEDIRVLQCAEDHPDTDPFNNAFPSGNYSFLIPQWYGYGFDKNLVVAEFPLSSARAELYLAIDAQ